MEMPATSWSPGRRKQHYKHTKQEVFSRTRTFRNLPLGEFENFPEPKLHGSNGRDQVGSQPPFGPQPSALMPTP